MKDHQHHKSVGAVAPTDPGYPGHPELPEPGSSDHAHHAHTGHDKHAGHSVTMFRDRFWISMLLTIPTLIWGHMLPRGLGYTPPDLPGSRWIAPLLGTVVFSYGGLVFLK